jgi:DNA-binding beta-propeller fold protein YncE
VTALADPQALPTPPEAAPPAPAAEDDDHGRRRKRFLLLLLLLLLGVLTILIVWYFLFRQPLPIPFVPQSELPKYSTSYYGVTRPLGIAVSPDGDRIYVTEGGAQSDALVLDGSGNRIAVMTPPAALAPEFEPVYVAIDPLTQEVYETDRLTGSIHIFSRDGTYLRELALAVARDGWQPVGIAFDAAGTLYVSDYAGPAVLAIDRGGAVTRVLGDTFGLKFPNGIAVDKDGSVYVTDSDNGRLVRFAADGQGLPVVGRGVASGKFGLPRGLGIDGSARLFAVDTTAESVLVFRAAGTDLTTLPFLGAFGAEGIGDGQFAFPSTVAVDGRGHVLIADTFNDRIQLWSY